jgi:hypothetical protein
MHYGPVNEDHAPALHVAVLFSSRCGMRVQSEYACLSVREASNLEILPGYGSDGSRRRLV